MRKALVVGIDHYTHIGPLTGCVNDAYAVKVMLDRHADGSVNFGTRLMVGTGPHDLLSGPLSGMRYASFSRTTARWRFSISLAMGTSKPLGDTCGRATAKRVMTGWPFQM